MATMERTAWLYTKGGESVRLEVRSHAEGVQFIVDGPGAVLNTFDLPPGTTVASLREEYEKNLLEDGYRLQVVSERRVEGERRKDAAPRKTGDRRGGRSDRRKTRAG